MGPKHKVKYFSKFYFLKKNLPNFKLEKKIFFEFFPNKKISRSLILERSFNFFAKVQEATKIYKNGMVIQYPSH